MIRKQLILFFVASATFLTSFNGITEAKDFYTGGRALRKSVDQPGILPAIFPAPQTVKLTGGSIKLGSMVTIVAGTDVENSSKELLIEILKKARVKHVNVASELPVKMGNTYIVLGTASSALTQSALKQCNATLAGQKEGYTLASISKYNAGLIVLG